MKSEKEGKYMEEGKRGKKFFIKNEEIGLTNGAVYDII